MENKPVQTKLLHHFVGFLFVWVITILIANLLWYTLDGIYYAMVAFICYGTFALIFWNRFTKWFTGTLAICCILLSIMLDWKQEQLPKTSLWLLHQLTMYIDSLKVASDLSFMAQLYVVFATAIIASLFIQKMIVKKEKYFPVLMPTFLLALLVDFKGDLVHPYVLYILLLNLAILFFETYFKRYVYTKSAIKSEIITEQKGVWQALLSAIFIGNVLLVMGFSLTSQAHDPLKFLDFLNEEVGPGRKDVKSIQAVSAFFYDEDNRLKEKVSFEDIEVMEVTSKKTLYLRGATEDLFDGVKWSRTESVLFTEPIKENDNMVSVSLKKAIMPFDPYVALNSAQELENWVAQSLTLETPPVFTADEVKVKLKNVESKIIFAPLNTYKTNFPASTYVARTLQDLLTVQPKVLKNGDTYILNYLNPLYEQPQFIGRLSSLKSNYDVNGFKNYLQMPSSMTQRTKDLAVELTKDKASNYEKAKRLEAYLRLEMTYSLETYLPEDATQDLIDYFLFEGKQGYCTYSATAMCLMLRSVDVPARVVEGYVARPTAREETGLFTEKELAKTLNETIHVMAKDAHTWVEAYLPGYGWMPFEPTGGYRITNEAIKEYESAAFDQSNEEAYQLAQMNKAKQFVWTPMKVTGLVIVLLLLGVGVIIGRYYLDIHHYQKVDQLKQALRNYEDIMVMIGLFGLHRNPSESIRHFFDRLKAQDHFKYDQFDSAVSVMEAHFYGQKGMTLSEVILLETYYNQIYRKLKRHHKKSRFLLICLKHRLFLKKRVESVKLEERED